MNKIFYTLLILFFSLSANAQQISINADNTPLFDVLQRIEKETEINFAYSNSTIQGIKISGHIHNEDIVKAMDQILAFTSLEYKRINNTILLREKISPKVPTTSFLIQGQVADSNNLLLPAAAVYINDTNLGVYTDEKGNFQLEIPREYINKELTISFLGYEDQTIKIIDKSEKLYFITMNEVQFTVENVLVVNHEKAIKVLSYEQYTQLTDVSKLGSSSVAGGDLTKSLQLLAGISATDDTSADIKIRGSNADATLMILDGMPLYNTSHYYGIFSSLNTSYVDKIDIYKNNIPLKYGNKTAGVVEVKSNNTSSDQIEGIIDLNLLTTSIFSKIPVRENTNLNIGFRKTIRNISNTQFNSFAPTRLSEIVFSEEENGGYNTVDPNFGFYDLNVQLNHSFKKNHSLSINYFRSDDVFEAEAERSFSIRKDAFILETEENEDWNTNAFSIQSINKIGNSTLHTSLYNTYSYQESNLEIHLENDEEEDRFGANEFSIIHDAGFDSHLNYRINNDSLSVGLGYVNHDLDYSFIDENEIIIEGDNIGNNYSMYGNFSSSGYSKTQFNLGLRGNFYTLNNSFFLSPRASINYDLKESIRLKAAYGYYNQNIRQLSYEYLGEIKYLWVSASDDIPSLKAHNSMIGFTNISDYITIDVEAYYKSLDKVIELASLVPGNKSMEGENTEYELFVGKGRSYGIDITLSGTYKNYSSYVAYTLSKSENSYPRLARGMYIPSQDDRRHQLKWINTIRYNRITLSGDYIFASGRRFTDLLSLGPNGDIRNTPNKRYDIINPYQRLDIGLNYNLPIRKYSLDMGLSIINVLNTQNVKYVQSVVSYKNDKGQNISNLIGNESSLLARTVNASIKLNF